MDYRIFWGGRGSSRDPFCQTCRLHILSFSSKVYRNSKLYSNLKVGIVYGLEPQSRHLSQTLGFQALGSLRHLHTAPDFEDILSRILELCRNEWTFVSGEVWG